MVHAHLRWSDKPFMGAVITPGRADDSIEMARIVYGERFTDEHCVIMGNEKLVLDADHLGAVHTLLGGLPVDSEALALVDAFREVGPGSHFFGCAHTLSRYETAFHECEIADTDSYENWIEAGGKDSMMRANAKWKETLRTCEPPPLDASMDEALKDFMARKKASMPDIWH